MEKFILTQMAKEVYPDIISLTWRNMTIENTAKGKFWKSRESVLEQLEGREITDI